MHSFDPAILVLVIYPTYPTDTLTCIHSHVYNDVFTKLFVETVSVVTQD